MWTSAGCDCYALQSREVVYSQAVAIHMQLLPLQLQGAGLSQDPPKGNVMMHKSPGGTLQQQTFTAQKEASAFFERFDRTDTKADLYHAGAHRSVDWLLSESVDGSPREGLIRGLSQLGVNESIVLLLPHTVTEALSLSQFHQIAREVVIGIYVFNQLPSLKFEPCHDSTSSCFLPSAYTNTLTGQTLLSVGYCVESLLHGASVPVEKHSKANELWRGMSVKSDPIEVLQEAGLVDMTLDAELGEDLYKEPEPYFPRYPAVGVDHELADRDIPHWPTTGELHAAKLWSSSIDFFRKFLKQISLSLVFDPRDIQQHKNLFLLNPQWDVETVFADAKGEVDQEGACSLQRYFQKQREFIRSKLALKSSIRHDLDLLQYISALVPLLVTLKKQHRVIQLSSLLPSLSPDRLHTEKDIPPLIPSDNSVWSVRKEKQPFACLNSGIKVYKQRQEALPLPDEIAEQYSQLVQKARQSNLTNEEDFALNATVTIESRKYCLIQFALEEYYPKSPRVPPFIHAMMQELRLCSQRLQPLNELRIQEFLYKPLGPKKAYKLKGVSLAIQACVEKGLVAPVASLLKRCTVTRLNKANEEGMTLLHTAALQAKDAILGQLLRAGADPAISCQPVEGCLEKVTGLVHLATRAGHVDSLFCLLQAGCSLTDIDGRGWAPIHYAAYYNYQSVLKFLLHHRPESIEAVTADKARMTPLLLAVLSGSLDAVKYLVGKGASLAATNANGEGIVRLAACHSHVDTLLYLMDLSELEDVYWRTLKEMLEEDRASGASVASLLVLDPLTKCGPHQHSFVHKYGLVPTLVGLLKETDRLQSLATQVLRNVCHHPEICDEIVKANGIPIVIRLLSSAQDDVQSCVCTLVCDLAMMVEVQAQFVASGAIPPLVALLSSEVHDVVLYSCAALGILARDYAKGQNIIAKEGGLTPVIELLGHCKPCIVACAAHTLSTIVRDNPDNQILAMKEEAKEYLYYLLKSTDTSVYCNAALAAECIASDNGACQRHFIVDTRFVSALVRLLKMADTEVKVRGAAALWAIAGSCLADKRFIAVRMDISCLVDTIGLGSEPLDFVCGEALGALASEMGENQAKIFQVGGVIPLVDILKQDTSERVFLCVIRCLAALAVKPALVPNKELQDSVCLARGIILLLQIMSKNPSELVRAEAACALAKLTLGNTDCQRALYFDSSFHFGKVFAFATSSDPQVRLVGGEAISVFVYNTPMILKQYLSLGRIEYQHYLSLLCSSSEEQQASAAFQITVLAKLLTGISSGQACVQGIKMLVYLTGSTNEEIQISCCEYIARLSHSYDGLSQVIIGAGGVDAMVVCLKSGNGPVVQGASVVLGYLSYNHTARRLILSVFRDEPHLFTVFNTNLYHRKVCPVFLSMWKDIQRDGLPALG